MNLIDQILMHLYDSIDYGFSYRLKKGLWISDYFDHWKKEISAKKIKNGIRELSKQKLIEKKKNYDASVIVTLTEKGRLRVLNRSFKNFCDKKQKWDGKWRMVAFDIPDERKKGRNALRYRMEAGGFYELQESLFLYPYDCEKEIKDFISLFKLEKYVRFALISRIDNEEEIKRVMRVK